MAKFRESPYAFVLAFVPYFVAASTGLLVVWLCFNGSHLYGSVGSGYFSKPTPDPPEHNPNDTNSPGGEIKLVTHCCACFGWPVLEQGLPDHSMSSTGWDDPEPSCGNGVPITAVSPSVVAHGMTPSVSSHDSGDSVLISLSTVILLI